MKGFIGHPQDRNFTTVSGDRHARSYERVHPAPAESQFYHSFGRSTRTILRKGRTQHGKIAILLQFRAINTHDLTKGSHRAPARSQFYYSFGRSTRTILRKGSSGTRKIAILLQFRAINTHDLTKGFIGHPQDRNFTTVSGDRHARSYERVASPQAFSGPWRPPPPHYLTNYLSKVWSKVLFLSN